MNENKNPSSAQPAKPAEPAKTTVVYNVVGSNEKSNKSWLVLVLLSFFLGGFGADRFYAGRVGLGLTKLFFGWATFYIWPLVDFVLAVVGRQKDSAGRYIRA